jgi:F0F1-type ATP synthase assembly protein I
MKVIKNKKELWADRHNRVIIMLWIMLILGVIAGVTVGRFLDKYFL